MVHQERKNIQVTAFLYDTSMIQCLQGSVTLLVDVISIKDNSELANLNNE